MSWCHRLSHFPINASALQKWWKSPFQLQESKTCLISFIFFLGARQYSRGKARERFFVYSLDDLSNGHQVYFHSHIILSFNKGFHSHIILSFNKGFHVMMSYKWMPFLCREYNDNNRCSCCFSLCNKFTESWRRLFSVPFWSISVVLMYSPVSVYLVLYRLSRLSHCLINDIVIIYVRNRLNYMLCFPRFP